MMDLLDTLQEPRRLTHILYKSNMSYTQLIKYLRDMIALDLIEKQECPYRAFRITSKGKTFLDLIRNEQAMKIT